jgi:hypothetical protein
MGRLWFLIVLIIDVVAILDVWNRESSMEKKNTLDCGYNTVAAGGSGGMVRHQSEDY